MELALNHAGRSHQPLNLKINFEILTRRVLGAINLNPDLTLAGGALPIPVPEFGDACYTPPILAALEERYPGSDQTGQYAAVAASARM